MNKRRSLIREVELGEDELRGIKHLLPAPEPALILPEGTPSGRILRVSEPVLAGNEKDYLARCVESNWISSGGPFIGEFEKAFSAKVGCEFGVACSSGTAALHLALAALGLGPGDEVIIPTFTMIATANAVAYTGATPVLVDAEPETWNIDVGQIEPKITSRTKAIIVVHTYGHPVEMQAIVDLARRNNLYVVEDAAEAHGALYQGRPIGSLGDVATFSFYGNKIITTGEGGMVTTNDGNIAKLARKLRDHAFSDEFHFWHKYRGFNYRMTNMQAAIGLAQTERLAELIEKRRQNRQWYEARLKNKKGLTLPIEKDGVKNVFWMYSLLIEKEFPLSRDELRIALAKRGIETRTLFIPIHLQPIYFHQSRNQAYPVAESLCCRGLYVPSGANLTEADAEYVAGEILRCAS